MAKKSIVRVASAAVTQDTKARVKADKKKKIIKITANGKICSQRAGLAAGAVWAAGAAGDVALFAGAV